MSAPGTPSSGGFRIPSYILDDLCSRFIINIPEEERQNLIRIFFQIELAHWFYLDFYCQENPSLKACGIKDFSIQIFQHCPTLIEHSKSLDTHFQSWKGYKMAVPTYGAIMLDPTYQYCLLVQGFWARSSWGFPKGKVNEEEAAVDCAVREVLEETGFDITPNLLPEEYLEYKLHEQLSRLYIVPGVSMDTKFLPRTRNEIKKLQWFAIDYLPAHKKDPICKQELELPPNAFFMVIPFVKPLRRWIGKHGNKELLHNTKHSNKEVYNSSQKTRPPQNKGNGVAADKDLLKPVRLFNNGMGETPPESPRTQRLSPARPKSKQTSPKPGGKKKQKAESPVAKIQILTRQGVLLGQKDKPVEFVITKPKAWTNLKINAEAMLACL